MSQFNAPIRRTGGSLDVYAVLLILAFLVLASGIGLLAVKNMAHSKDGGASGGVLTLVK